MNWKLDNHLVWSIHVISLTRTKDVKFLDPTYQNLYISTWLIHIFLSWMKFKPNLDMCNTKNKNLTYVSTRIFMDWSIIYKFFGYIHVFSWAQTFQNNCRFYLQSEMELWKCVTYNYTEVSVPNWKHGLIQKSINNWLLHDFRYFFILFLIFLKT